MGKTALILVAGLSLTLGTINLNLGRQMSDAEELAVGYYETQMAQNVARSAVNHTLAQLCIRPNMRGTFVHTNLYAEGSHDTVVIIGGNSVTNPTVVRVTAGYGAKAHQIKIKAQLFSTSVPPRFQYANLSDGNLELEGNIRIQLDPALSGLNADVHTNGNLDLTGATNSIQGFGSYVGNGSSNPPSAINSAFDPNENPAGLPVHAKGPYVEVPIFKAEEFAHLATQTTDGEVTLSGSQTFSSDRSNPTIWYITGKLTMHATITGYVIFLVKGNVEITGNTTITATDEGKSTIGIYSNGNVDIKGNVTAHAQIQTYGNVKMEGNSKLYGSVIADGNIDYNGTIDMYYRPANAALTSPFWPGLLRAAIIAWYE